MTQDAKPGGLDTTFRLGKGGDDVYAALIEAHRGLPPDESNRFNARLVLMLANHIGEPEIVIETIRRAREGMSHGPSGEQ